MRNCVYHKQIQSASLIKKQQKHHETHHHAYSNYIVIKISKINMFVKITCCALLCFCKYKLLSYVQA